MTTRRVRHRHRQAFSALKDLVLGERPIDVLNKATPNVTRCAWPACRAPMQFITPVIGSTGEHRYGVLCPTHAVDVAIAVIQHQADINRLQVGERLKIGYSADVKRRMRAYPPGSKLLAVEPGDLELERQRHQQFAGSRTDGREWFRPTPDLMELTRELVDVYGDPKRFAHHYRKNEDPVRIRRTS
jgi:hypothetical protein